MWLCLTKERERIGSRRRHFPKGALLGCSRRQQHTARTQMVLPQHRTSTATRITPSMAVRRHTQFGAPWDSVVALELHPHDSKPIQCRGHPTHTQSGTCYCGSQDHYGQCNPSLAMDSSRYTPVCLLVWVVLCRSVIRSKPPPSNNGKKKCPTTSIAIDGCLLRSPSRQSSTYRVPRVHAARLD